MSFGCNALFKFTTFALSKKNKMKIYTRVPEVNAIPGPIATIGIFDGVHTGHRAVLSKLAKVANALGGSPVVITMWPHPRLVLNPEDRKLRFLSTLSEKEKLLEAAGVEHLIVLPFTQEFARLDPCTFILQYLVEKTGVRHLLVGFDHHFGRDREGNYERIAECAANYGFTVEQQEAVSTDGAVISSTLIRNLLETGQLEEANAALGYPYSLTGTVTEGRRLGRELGYPTANILPEEPWKLVPSSGVYAVEVLAEGKMTTGMLNIGFRPTVNDDRELRTIEVHIFDFHHDLYGKKLTLAFRKKLRDERRFDSLDLLKKQLAEDEQKAREFFGIFYRNN